MGASWLYRKSSSLQCLSNLFLNVLTFGAVTTESGNSFSTLVILAVKDCLLKFNFEPSWHNLKRCPLVPSLETRFACNLTSWEYSPYSICHVRAYRSLSYPRVLVYTQELAILRFLVSPGREGPSCLEVASKVALLCTLSTASIECFFSYGDHIKAYIQNGIWLSSYTGVQSLHHLVIQMIFLWLP